MTETTTFTTARFGDIEPRNGEIIQFEQGLVGLPGLTRFLPIPHGQDSPFVWLQSLDDSAFAFLVVDPNVFVPEYDPGIPAHDAAKIGLDTVDSAIVYTVVTIPQGRPDEMTLNLAGPILVNLETRQARQVVLDTDEWAVKHPAFRQDQEAAA